MEFIWSSYEVHMEFMRLSKMNYCYIRFNFSMDIFILINEKNSYDPYINICI